MDYRTYFDQHPLRAMHNDLLDRIKENPSIIYSFGDDMQQYSFVCKAIGEDYVEYLRECGREVTPMGDGFGVITLGDMAFPVVIGDHTK
jgi:hypothetical protein